MKFIIGKHVLNGFTLAFGNIFNSWSVTFLRIVNLTALLTTCLSASHLEK